MRFAKKQVSVALLAASFLTLSASGARPILGQEPGRLARLFRLGGASRPANPPAPNPLDELRPFSPPNGPASAAPENPATLQPAPRILPQPRNVRAVTESDPIVTRISLGRANDGHTYGLFCQVYADGTVIDGEGVHQAGRDGVKPVLDALQSGEIYRLRGHCGAPATDSIEHIQFVVYERSLRGLKATSFSSSGNPQGCDASVKRLQDALETLQLKLARPANIARTPSTSASVSPASPPIQLNQDSISPREP